MSTEVNLKPGWFIKDVRKAAERLNEWSTAANNSILPSLAGQSQKESTSSASTATRNGTGSNNGTND